MHIGFPASSRFQRDAKLLLVVTALSSLSFFGIYVLIRTLYLLRLGHGPEYVGIYGAVGALGFMFMSMPSGAMGTRLGPGPVMLVGGIIAGGGMLLLPLAESVPTGWRDLWPLLSQAIVTIGWALLRVNVLPALMMATPAELRHDAFALESALRALGTLLGTVGGGALPELLAAWSGLSVDVPGPYATTIILAAVLTILAVLPLLFVGKLAPQQEPHQDAASDSSFPFWPISLVVLHVFLTHGAWAVPGSFANVYFDTVLLLSPAMIGLITGAGQLAATVAPLLGPRISKRRGARWTLVTTSWGVGLSLLPMALIPSIAAAGASRVAGLAFAALWQPAVQLFQMDMVAPRWRGLSFGAVSLAMSLSFGVVSLVGGHIAATTGYQALFLMGMGMSTAGALLLMALLRLGILSAPGGCR